MQCNFCGVSIATFCSRCRHHIVARTITLECPPLQVSSTALNTSENILMCAPTGAGKTNVAMLAILHTMSLYRNAETGKIDTSKFKIVYVAPMKVPASSCCAITVIRLNAASEV